MTSIRSKDTKPEMVVRQLLHSLGYRFRLHYRNLPGTPDLVFPAKQKVIQVHGCFWHQHEGCHRARMPLTNRDYWTTKLARNRERDRQASVELAALGWEVMTIWECELAKDLTKVTAILVEFLGNPATLPAAYRLRAIGFN